VATGFHNPLVFN